MSTELTLEEQATNFATMQHIHLVNRNLNTIIRMLLTRGEDHDKTKLTSPELQAFTAETKNLSALEYGSPEYTANLARIQPALDHHYANARHHPQHFKRGIDDMNIVDLIELYCDWAASCKRHRTGNLHKSIEINAKRFNIAPQLVSVFENSVELLEDA